jgi:hypothetical protein
MVLEWGREKARQHSYQGRTNNSRYKIYMSIDIIDRLAVIRGEQTV